MKVDLYSETVGFMYDMEQLRLPLDVSSLLEQIEGTLESLENKKEILNLINIYTERLFQYGVYRGIKHIAEKWQSDLPTMS